MQTYLAQYVLGLISFLVKAKEKIIDILILDIAGHLRKIPFDNTILRHLLRRQ